MRRASTTIAIASGKGGVGKSVIAVNLAETLASLGHQTALLDADGGQGACHILLNETPPLSVADVARAGHDVRTSLCLTSAGLTLVQMASDPDSQDARLFQTIDETLLLLRREHEYVIIDAPAGVDGAVRWAFDRADLGAVVLVEEPTAVADAYRLARMIWHADPDYPLASIVNFADSQSEAASVAERFGHVTWRFVGRVPNYLGWVPFCPSVRRSVRDQVPAVRLAGPIRTAFETLASTLIRGRTAPLELLSA
jgi:flagellar biosynthesis protein FlhG